MIAMGDFNAPYQSLGSRTTSRKGEKLLDLITDLNWSYVDNTEMTYISDSNNSSNILDFMFINDKTSPQLTRTGVDGDLGSDHLPLWADFRNSGSPRNERIRIYKSNWQGIAAHMEHWARKELDEWAEEGNITPTMVDEELAKLTWEWNKAKEANRKPVKVRTKDGIILSAEAGTLIRNVRRLGKLRNDDSLTEEDKGRLRKEHNYLKRKMRQVIE